MIMFSTRSCRSQGSSGWWSCRILVRRCWQGREHTLWQCCRLGLIPTSSCSRKIRGVRSRPGTRSRFWRIESASIRQGYQLEDLLHWRPQRQARWFDSSRKNFSLPWKLFWSFCWSRNNPRCLSQWFHHHPWSSSSCFEWRRRGCWYGFFFCSGWGSGPCQFPLFSSRRTQEVWGKTICPGLHASFHSIGHRCSWFPDRDQLAHQGQLLTIRWRREPWQQY